MLREHPDVVLKSGATLKRNQAVAADPVVQEKRSRSQKESWDHNPVRKQAASDRMIERWNDEEESIPLREALEMLQLLEIKELVITNLRAALKTPEVRARFRAARKDDWRKPEVKKKFLTHVRDIWEKRKRKLAEADRILAERNIPGSEDMSDDQKLANAYLIVAPAMLRMHKSRRRCAGKMMNRSAVSCREFGIW